jgi:hypothetical protein
MLNSVIYYSSLSSFTAMFNGITRFFHMSVWAIGYKIEVDSFCPLWWLQVPEVGGGK